LLRTKPVDNIPKKGIYSFMTWTVEFTGKAKKLKEKLPARVREALFVAVWREDKDKIRFVEVIYAGTHKKAPY